MHLLKEEIIFNVEIRDMTFHLRVYLSPSPRSGEVIATAVPPLVTRGQTLSANESLHTSHVVSSLQSKFRYDRKVAAM